MMDGISIPARRLDTKPGVLEVTRIFLNVDHNSNRKTVMLSAYPGDEDGLWITQGVYKNVAPMPRLNRKTVEALRAALVAEIRQEKGVGWEAVEQLCQEYGLVVVR